MIPKIIHYCWFGKGEMDEVSKRCIESWKKFLPDYELKLWNEDNFDVNETEYTKKAYEEGKWAFVSDYVRCKALYEEGGIYMDTDIEVFKSFDKFLQLPYVFKFKGGFPIDVAFFMAEKGNEVFKHVIEDMKKIPYYDTPILCKILSENGRKHKPLYMIDTIGELKNDGNRYSFSNDTFIGDYITHYENNSWK